MFEPRPLWLKWHAPSPPMCINYLWLCDRPPQNRVPETIIIIYVGRPSAWQMELGGQAMPLLHAGAPLRMAPSHGWQATAGSCLGAQGLPSPPHGPRLMLCGLLPTWKLGSQREPNKGRQKYKALLWLGRVWSFLLYGRLRRTQSPTHVQGEATQTLPPDGERGRYQKNMYNRRKRCGGHLWRKQAATAGFLHCKEDLQIFISKPWSHFPSSDCLFEFFKSRIHLKSKHHPSGHQCWPAHLCSYSSCPRSPTLRCS